MHSVNSTESACPESLNSTYGTHGPLGVKIMNVEVCEVLLKPLILVQEWPNKNEVIELCNKKNIEKICTSRVLHFKPAPKNLIPKRLIFCL
jgi:hypothetical protein